MQSKHEDFILARNSGVSIKELCERFNICKSTAYNWIKLYAPKKRIKERIFTAHDFYQLERKIKKLQTELEIFRRCGCSLNSPLDEKITAIEHLKDDFSVHMLCKTLNVLKSTYYHRVLRSPVKTQSEIIDENLSAAVKEIFYDSNERFGAQKIKYVLKQRGYHVSRAHISRLMQELGVVCKQMRLRYFNTTNRKYKVYRNRIQQKFMTAAPNMVWVSDITYVYVKETLHAIGVIIDLYARKVIAFNVAKAADSDFVQKMFDDAFEKRNSPTDLIFHSDQGVQYTAYKFRKHLRDCKVKQSFSNPGTPLDNAVAESFFACMKREELSHSYYHELETLQHSVANYIKFFNDMRPHHRLGMHTPTETERKFEQDNGTA